MLDAAIPLWQLLGDPAPDALGEAREVLRWGARAVASVANTCLRPLDDDSHLALGWLAEPGMLAGVYTTSTPRYRAALRVADLTLHLVDVEGASVAQGELQGKTLAEALDWLGSAILAFSGAPPARPLKPPQHQMPDHPIGEGAPFGLAHPSEFAELARWFADGDAMLRTFAGADPRASAVRCWPRQLELVTRVILDEGVEPERARAVSLSLFPGDADVPGPCFRVTPHPAPSAAGARPLPGGARWVEDGELLRAVLPAQAVVEPPTAEAQALRVADFLERACAEAQRLLAARD